MSHWRTQSGEVLEYDCRDCRLKGRDTTRACFRFRAQNHVPAAFKTADGVAIDDERTSWVDRAEALRRVDTLEGWLAGTENLIGASELLGICPESLIADDEVERWIELEALSEAYHIPPVAGSLEDMPARMLDAFATIRSTHTRCRNEQLKKLKARTAARGN